mmetsp:Transcript_6018/g.9127  ORF Transcript_6018/g.9127 Transcript_6018/m.9127 type:complete len:250 (+) Transcript_6018:84-833(+)
MKYLNAMSLVSLLWSISSRSSSIPLVSAFTPSALTIRSTRTLSSTCTTKTMTSLKSSVEEVEEVDPGEVDGTDFRVLKYPHPALRAPNVEITEEELKSGEFSKIAKEMFLVMYATKGVGLAAPQVGINKRLMVFNQSGDKKKWLEEVVMANPKIVEYSDAVDVETEGCLSFPGMDGDVMRSKWIKVEAQKLNGKKMKKKFIGWEARIFQHEYDHLDGIVYPDRLEEEGKGLVKERLGELVEEFGEGGSL